MTHQSATSDSQRVDTFRRQRRIGEAGWAHLASVVGAFSVDSAVEPQAVAACRFRPTRRIMSLWVPSRERRYMAFDPRLRGTRDRRVRAIPLSASIY